jgi:hypothetical protein
MTGQIVILVPIVQVFGTSFIRYSMQYVIPFSFNFRILSQDRIE